jgi:hypothetical protein
MVGAGSLWALKPSIEQDTKLLDLHGRQLGFKNANQNVIP